MVVVLAIVVVFNIAVVAAMVVVVGVSDSVLSLFTKVL